MIESGNTSSHKIYFSGNSASNGMYLWNSSTESKNLTLQNGGFSANTLQPTSSVAIFTACSANQVGTMAQQLDSNTPVKSQLQCSYDALQCQGLDPTGYIQLESYCYLPVVSISVGYKPNSSSFTCPVGYIDNSAPPVVTTNMSTLVMSNFYKSCVVGDTSPYTDYYCIPAPNTVCIWATPELPPLYINSKTYKSYTIYQGIGYTPSWDWVYKKGNNTTKYGITYPICPPLTNAESTMAVINSATCTTANPTVTYDY